MLFQSPFGMVARSTSSATCGTITVRDEQDPSPPDGGDGGDGGGEVPDRPGIPSPPPDDGIIPGVDDRIAAVGGGVVLALLIAVLAGT